MVTDTHQRGEVHRSFRGQSWLPVGSWSGYFHYGSSGTYLPVERKCGVATVSFSDATRVYPGADHPSVDKLNLDIGDGEFMVLVGPSGCGKSTSLRMLAGLEEINAGSI